MNKNWIWIVVISIIWVLSAIGIYYIKKDFGLLFLAVNAFAVVVATSINIVNSLRNAQIREKEIEFHKIEHSFEFLERWDSPLLKEARDFTRNIRKERAKLSDDVLIEKINGEPALERSVITVFNYWQDMYLSIIYNRANEEILRRTLSDVYISMYDRFKPWLKEMSQRDPKGAEDHKNLYDRWYLD